MTKLSQLLASLALLALLGRNGAEEETVIESVNEGNMMSAMLNVAKIKSKSVMLLLYINLMHWWGIFMWNNTR